MNTTLIDFQTRESRLNRKVTKQVTDKNKIIALVLVLIGVFLAAQFVQGACMESSNGNITLCE